MMGNAGSGGPEGGLRGLLGRRGVVPLIGGLAVVLVVGLVLVMSASGSGDDSKPQARATSASGDSGGLARSTTTVTPQATLNLSAPTVVATRPPNSGGARRRLRRPALGQQVTG